MTGTFEFWQRLTQEASRISLIEWISTATQIASVWYAKKNNILVYPTGIIGVIFAAWVYLMVAKPPLYADGILNIYYFFMSIYGWYHWQQKKGSALAYPISRCNIKSRFVGVMIGFCAWAAIYFMLTTLSDSDQAMLDALVSASAITAMWWMAQRKIENWLAWIVSNIIAIPLNYYKGFMLFTCMYVIFLGLAVAGYYSWKRMLST